MRVTKRLDLPTLQAELAAAGLPVTSLGLSGELPDDPGAQELFTYSGEGTPLDLPPAAGPVVDAHVPPPLVVEFAGRIEQERIERTTDASFHEVFRVPTVLKHVYDGTVSVIGIDAANGVTKSSTARLVFKHTPTGLVQVGSTVQLFNAEDTAASTWAIAAQVQGADLVIGVRGAAGRTIDWAVTGSVAFYAPDGL